MTWGRPKSEVKFKWNKSSEPKPRRKFFHKHRPACMLMRPVPHLGKAFLKPYSCDEVRENQEEWKAYFWIDNSCERVEKVLGKPDERYLEFCKEIDDFLNKCYCG